jgi:calcineurin-like phosphoesterase family protein
MRTAAVLGAALATMVGLLTPAGATTKTITAEADSFVLSSSPNAKRGGATSLRVLNAVKTSYIRFNVSGLPAGEVVHNATLRVNATSGSTCAVGVEVFRAANDTWGETTITWNNQPGPIGSALATTTWTRNGYVSFDVTSAVGGSGRVSFVLRHVPGCSAARDTTFRSRETTQPPQLVVETDPAPPPGGVTVAAAGDIVCDPTNPNYGGANPGFCQHRATDDLLAGVDAVLGLGDLQYDDGTLDLFNEAYDPTWGQFSPTTYPAPGNHEYHVPSAQGYFDYWASKGRPTGGVGSGYFSFDLGSWHVISLNSGSCVQVPCAEGSAQNNFLEQDLASTTKPCIAAYWHHPLFNSGVVHGDVDMSRVRPFWDDLYAAGADIVLNGHEHNYQRYAKQSPTGDATPTGIREFVVGTGGSLHYGLLATPDANFEFGNATSFGVLRLTLSASGYSWEFVGVGGEILDSGGPVACN